MSAIHTGMSTPIHALMKGRKSRKICATVTESPSAISNKSNLGKTNKHKLLPKEVFFFPKLNANHNTLSEHCLPQVREKLKRDEKDQQNHWMPDTAQHSNGEMEQRDVCRCAGRDGVGRVEQGGAERSTHLDGGGIRHAEPPHELTAVLSREEALLSRAPSPAHGPARVVEHEGVAARRGSQAGLVAVRLGH